MKDAQVKSQSSPVVIDRSRLGQVTWINNFDAAKYFDALDTRIKSFTGFSTKTAEQYQIVNYGLGGHYTPHHDPFIKGTVRNTFIYIYWLYLPNFFFKYRLKMME